MQKQNQPQKISVAGGQSTGERLGGEGAGGIYAALRSVQCGDRRGRSG